jgi:hypothetical protein
MLTHNYVSIFITVSLFQFYTPHVIQVSVVIIITTPLTGPYRVFYFGRDKRFFFSPKAFRPAVGSTQPPIQWVTGTFPIEIKWPGHETDYSHLSRALVKKAFMVCVCGETPHLLPLYINIFPYHMVHTKNQLSWLRYLLPFSI